MLKRLIPILLCTSWLYSESPSELEQSDTEKLSEALGHLIGKNLRSVGLSIDVEALARGMENASNGKEAPLTEDECVQALSQMQEEHLSRQSEANLAEAVDFLTKNANEDGISSLEDGKLQYKIDKAGNGETVQPYNTPVIRYQGRYLNGTAFGSSVNDEAISFDSIIPGLAKAIVGMQEGEKRIIYVHPDLGYGKNHPSMPNALLVFDIELIKADTSADAQATAEESSSSGESALR